MKITIKIALILLFLLGATHGLVYFGPPSVPSITMGTILMILGFTLMLEFCSINNDTSGFISLSVGNLIIWLFGGIWVNNSFMQSDGQRTIFVVDGKILAKGESQFILPFSSDIKVFRTVWEVNSLGVNGKTKDGVGISGKLSAELTHSNDLEKLRRDGELESEIHAALQQRFAEAISKLDSKEIQLSGLGLEISIGQSEIPLPSAVELDGEIKLRNIWPVFRKSIR